MAKRYEHLADKPRYKSYEDPKGRTHKDQYDYLGASQLGGSHEKAYLQKMEDQGWELCGAPVSPSLGGSYVYYWKKPIA